MPEATRKRATPTRKSNAAKMAWRKHRIAFDEFCSQCPPYPRETISSYFDRYRQFVGTMALTRETFKKHCAQWGIKGANRTGIIEDGSVIMRQSPTVAASPDAAALAVQSEVDYLQWRLTGTEKGFVSRLVREVKA